MAATSPAPSSARTILVGAAVAGAVLSIYLLRLDATAGLIGDDAWYVLLARSLANGDGFGMANSPVPNGVTPYPPGFPLLLAIVFRFAAGFPENVWLLKGVSIAAMLGVGALSYWYLSRARGLDRSIAALCAIAIVITPAFVFLATSTVMSECVFTLVQLAAVALLGPDADTSPARRRTALAGAAAAAAVLVRSAGISVVAAGIVYLAYRKQWRRAVVFAATALVVLAPWLWYSRAHAPTMAERLAQGGGHALSYAQNFWLRRASDATSGTISAREVPARVAANLLDVAVRDVGGLVVPALFRRPAESGHEVLELGASTDARGSMGGAAGTMIVSLAFFAIAAIGFVAMVRRGVTAAELVVVFSLVTIVLWPFWPFRFVLPLAPFLFLYLVAGIRRLVSPAAVLRIVLLAVVGLHVLDHVQHLATRGATPTNWSVKAAEVEATLRWMNDHLREPGHVATTNPPLVYLRTGRKTVAIDDPAGNWARWKLEGVRYMVGLDRVPLPGSYLSYRVRYQSPEQGLWVIEF